VKCVVYGERSSIAEKEVARGESLESILVVSFREQKGNSKKSRKKKTQAFYMKGLKRAVRRNRGKKEKQQCSLWWEKRVRGPQAKVVARHSKGNTDSRLLQKKREKGGRSGGKGGVKEGISYTGEKERLRT